jgi:hypothetical protein
LEEVAAPLPSSKENNSDTATATTMSSQEDYDSLKHLIRELLERDRTKRLGNRYGLNILENMDEIKAHPFFQEMDWSPDGLNNAPVMEEAEQKAVLSRIFNKQLETQLRYSIEDKVLFYGESNKITKASYLSSSSANNSSLNSTKLASKKMSYGSRRKKKKKRSKKSSKKSSKGDGDGKDRHMNSLSISTSMFEGIMEESQDDIEREERE